MTTEDLAREIVIIVHDLPQDYDGFISEKDYYSVIKQISDLIEAHREPGTDE
jgi:hypothetical protein